MNRRLVLGLIYVLVAFPARADIYRWDNGQVIPGTEGITPGPGIQLDHRDLVNANLHAMNLTAANFAASDLTGAELSLSVLTNSDFMDTNLTDATLARSSLSGANLKGSVVIGASLGATTPGGFTKEQLYSTKSYQDKNLHAIELGGNDLTDWDFTGVDLSDARFGRHLAWNASVLMNVDFTGANLKDAYFYQCQLENANLTGATVTGTRFSSTGLTSEQLYSTASYQEKDLQRIYLDHNDLTGWDFREQNLSRVKLGDATLTNADFTGANLTDAELGTTPLTSANLTGADLRGALVDDLAGAVTRNLIWPNGHLITLDLAAQETLWVRDYDGSPYDPPNTLRPIAVESSLSIEESGRLGLIFDSDPWDSLISFEPGIPVQLGGTLELTFADDVNVATQVGRTLRIFDWTGVSPVGQFQVSSPYTWELSKLYTTGEVTLLSPTALPGDFNQDGTVDSADYVVWRNGLGTTYTQNDYEVWRAHFGESFARGPTTNSAVPEPAAALLALIAMLPTRFGTKRSRAGRHRRATRLPIHS
jgi:uncharacterized protein YjbI with pentapeptide repeats